MQFLFEKQYNYNASIGEMLQIFQEKELSGADLTYISAKLRQGNLALLPTETVLGLFCLSNNLSANTKLFNLKGRNEAKKLAYYVNRTKQIERICGFKPPHLNALVKNFLPGPLTLVYENGDITLGFRMPARKSFQKILKHLDTPLLGTSANLSGQPDCLTLESFQESLGEAHKEVEIQMEPDTSIVPENQASTVALIRENEIKILREGSISLSDIEAVI